MDQIKSGFVILQLVGENGQKTSTAFDLSPSNTKQLFFLQENGLLDEKRFNELFYSK